MRDDFRNYVIFKWVMLILFTISFLKIVMMYTLGIFAWDFSYELSGFSSRALSIAQNNFRANNSVGQYYGIMIYSVGLFAVGVLGAKSLISKINAHY